MARLICGVDVSQGRLDARLPGAAEAESFANDREGIGRLEERCRAAGVELVAMEASGGYERLAFALLSEAGVGCALADARQVRRFAQAMGFAEKTDRIDAGVIARFAEVKGLVAMAPASLEQRRLTALARRLSQLAEDVSTAKRRLASARAGLVEPMVVESLQAQIAALETESRRFEREIATLVAADPLWRELDRAFREIKGVASRTVARLLADLPEIGLVSNKAAAKIAGLAPLADDSGRREGPRHIAGGRDAVRSILFLVARIAARFDASLQDFAQRLQQKGKPKMVVRIALAHKLLVRLNAKARDTRAALALAA